MMLPEFKGITALFCEKAKEMTRFVKKKKPGISLAEMLLALAILGILAAILMPVLKSAQPDKLEALHKKGNYIVEHVVADIAFDEDLYPPTQTKTGLGSIGAVTVDGVTYAGEEKFCELFASRVNKAPGSTTNCSAGKKTFTSIEGIDWYLPISSFDGSRPYEEIKFDVNGSQGPNCRYDEASCPHPDTFIYYIKPTGKLYTNEPTGVSTTYCINLTKVGPGSVVVKPKYGGAWSSLASSSCGKAPGEYLLKATPAAGYEATPWTERNVTITDSDVDVSIEFRLIPEPEMRQIVLTKTRNYGFLGGIFSADKISDGHVYLGDQEIAFADGQKGCYSPLDIFKLSPGCKIYQTVVEVEAGQYSLWAQANEKSSVEKIEPTTIDVTSKDGTGEVSFVWSYYDDERYDVRVPMSGDHYCFNGINNSTVSGTLVGQKTNTNYDLTINAAGGCTWEWDLSDPSINYGNQTDKTVGGKIRDKDVNVPIRMIAPAGAVDENPIKHKVIVNQICPDGSSMCATVQGAGEYAEGTSGIKVKVQPYEGLSSDWSEQTVNVGTEDVILTVTMTEGSYCIYTSISGSGTVQPTATYCGLTPGTYTLTAIPATGWAVSGGGWTEVSSSPKQYQKSVTITNTDVHESVSFAKQEDKTYCVNLQINCPYKNAADCGTYQVTGISPSYPITSLSIVDTLASKCGLSNGSYLVTVIPNTDKANLKNNVPSTYRALIENANYENTIDFEKIKARLAISLFVKLDDGLTIDAVERNVGDADFMYKFIFTEVETGDTAVFQNTIKNAEFKALFNNLDSNGMSVDYDYHEQYIPIGHYKLSYVKAYHVLPDGTQKEISNSITDGDYILNKNGLSTAFVYTIYIPEEAAASTEATPAQASTPLPQPLSTRSAPVAPTVKSIFQIKK